MDLSAVGGFMGGVGAGAPALAHTAIGLEEMDIRKQEAEQRAKMAPLHERYLTAQTGAVEMATAEKAKEMERLNKPWDPKKSPLLEHMSPEFKDYYLAHAAQYEPTERGKMQMTKGMGTDIALLKGIREAHQEFGNSTIEKLTKDLVTATKAGDYEKANQISGQLKEEQNKYGTTQQRMDSAYNDLSLESSYNSLSATQKEKLGALYNRVKYSTGDTQKEARKEYDKAIGSLGKGKQIEKSINLGDKEMIVYTDGTISYLKKGKLPVEHKPTEKDLEFASYKEDRKKINAERKRQGLPPEPDMSREQYSRWRQAESARIRAQYGGKKKESSETNKVMGGDTEAETISNVIRYDAQGNRI